VSEEQQNEDTAPNAPSELEMLRERAKVMGIKFSGNTGVDTLKAKINEKLEGKGATEKEEVEATVENGQLNPLAGDSKGQKPSAKLTLREQLRRDCLKLVRVRITNLDPKKANLPGEIFTVGNKYVGTIKKYVPYGAVTDDGWHLPHILYENLAERKFLHIRTFKDPQTKRDRQETSWQREFAFEVLPTLDEEELAKLANAQMAANNT
jgi:hypothetical protein